MGIHVRFMHQNYKLNHFHSFPSPQQNKEEMGEMKFFHLSHPSQQLLFFHVVVFLIISSSVQPTTSTTFDFQDFKNNVRSGDCPKGQNLICLQGDAVLDDLNGGIDLTSNGLKKTVYYGSGRIVYSDPIPLWDNQTKTTTNFTSEFLFAINTLDGNPHGDGIAFFLSPYPSIIPPNSTGGRFGLTSSNSTAANSSRFVAVEFDSIKNIWDQSPVDHVGIDVNSVQSKAYVNLSIEGFDSGIGKARVTYNSFTKNLSLFLDFDDNQFWLRTSILSYIIDLSDVLPEQVAIGFSAASSGSRAELHRIVSWKFSTGLDDPRAIFMKRRKRAAIVVMIILLVCLVLVVSGCLFRKLCHKSPKPKGSVRL